jgi:hypothetical protein
VLEDYFLNISIFENEKEYFQFVTNELDKYLKQSSL